MDSVSMDSSSTAASPRLGETELPKWTDNDAREDTTLPTLPQSLSVTRLKLDAILAGGLDDAVTETNDLPTLDSGAALVSSLEVAFESIVLTSLSEADRYERVQAAFIRAVSSGNLERVRTLLDSNADTRKYIRLDEKDEHGSTALIYAACFGHAEIAQQLLEAGATVDLTDKGGWSALVWATTNSQPGIVALLLKHGASSETTTSKGIHVQDFAVDVETEDVLSKEASRLLSKVHIRVATVAQEDGAASSDIAHDLGSSRKRLTHLSRSASYSSRLLATEDNAQHPDMPPLTSSRSGFDWSSCQPHQMLVFDETRLQHIMDVLIRPFAHDGPDTDAARAIADPKLNVPASVLFLAARYAAHFCGTGMVSELLETLEKALKSRFEIESTGLTDAQVINGISLWITQLCLLAQYIGKDQTMDSFVRETNRINILISDLYYALANYLRTRLSSLVDEAVLDCDTIDFGSLSYDHQPGLLAQKEEGAPKKSMFSPTRRHPVIITRTISKEAFKRQSLIPTLLSTLLSALRENDVPPSIARQLMAQVFYHFNAVIFDVVISHRDSCSRAKAIQIKNNLAKIEEWLHVNVRALPDPNVDLFLAPTVKLLQFLQLLSTFSSLDRFVELQHTFSGNHGEGLTWAQIRRAIVNYTYEVGEPRVAGEVEEYVDMCFTRTRDVTKRDKLQRRATISPVGPRSGSPSTASPVATLRDTEDGDSVRAGAGETSTEPVAVALSRSASFSEPARLKKNGAVLYRRVSLERVRKDRSRPSSAQSQGSSAESEVPSLSPWDGNPTRDTFDADYVCPLRIPNAKEMRDATDPQIPDAVLDALDGN